VAGVEPTMVATTAFLARTNCDHLMFLVITTISDSG
jgi:hypothetical protein